MVLKPRRHTHKKRRMFESSVNSDGTQTDEKYSKYDIPFESSVNSDGTQTAGKG